MTNKQGIFLSIIICFFYAIFLNPGIYNDILGLIATMLGTIIIPVFIAFLFSKDYSYGARLFWCTIIISIASAIGNKL